jgi:hypothetical protein
MRRGGGLTPAAQAEVTPYVAGTATPYTAPLYPGPDATAPLLFPVATGEDGVVEVWSDAAVRLELEAVHPTWGANRVTLDVEWPPDYLDPSGDPFPQYATDADLAAHAAAADPHAGYLTPGEADGAYAALDHTHPEQVVGYYILSTLTAMVEPQTGRFRVDSGDSTTATQLAMHHTSSKGTDAQAFFQAMAAGDTLWFQQQPEYERWTRYRVTAAPTVNPTWSLVPVAVESAGLAIQPNQTAFVQLTMAAGAGGGGAPLDYARLVVSATAPAAPAPPSDAFWLNPTEVA